MVVFRCKSRLSHNRSSSSSSHLHQLLKTHPSPRSTHSSQKWTRRDRQSRAMRPSTSFSQRRSKRRERQRTTMQAMQTRRARQLRMHQQQLQTFRRDQRTKHKLKSIYHEQREQQSKTNLHYLFLYLFTPTQYHG